MDVTLPTDLRLTLMQVYQDHINNQNQVLKDMFFYHEIELSLLWVAFAGLALVVVGEQLAMRKVYANVR